MSPDPSAAPASPTPEPSSRLHYPVVGLGASAGGMQALTRFFEQMPRHNGMAFVVVIHLSPTHESHAASILQRVTQMPVSQVASDTAIEPEHVYVIPPGHGLSMEGGRLLLRDDARVDGRNTSIDSFFRVLAQVHGHHAVSIVLSGTGTDGSVGLTRIKEQGGVTLAQAPDDAEHAGMPGSAIATGMVDFVLPAAKMPAKLMQLAANARAIRLPGDAAPAGDAMPAASPEEARRFEAALTEIMALLRTRTRHDFRHYKRPTVLRRLERRMQVTGMPSLVAYREYLRNHADETPALLQDMLISVTNFFRDREAFEALERDALPPLHQRLGGERALRAWVVGCATGEEAYSLAMLLHEARDTAAAAGQPFQVFASDIDERALAVARAGLYPGSIITDVVPSRLRQFFIAEQSHYRIVKGLRERVLFAHHNLLRDPPFSRVDLICCRNLLIYLDASAQAAALDIFRFALNPGGVLFLGSSESADGPASPFSAIDKKHRLYRLRPNGTLARTPPLATDTHARSQPIHLGPGSGPAARSLPYAELHQRAREAGAPPSVLIDAQQKILHMADDVSRFLQAQGGLPSQQLLDNLHPQLQLAARTALFKSRPAASGEAPQPASTEADLGDSRVRLTVRPVRVQPDEADLLLVSFDDMGLRTAPLLGPAGSTADDVVRELEAEHRRLQQQLQEVIEHSEASTEELMSSNEELQALNEELRSATEELETSREELQSTNEELTTVNGELASKVEETGRINDDLQNLINANDIATVFVDRQMQIKRYTPRAAELFNLIPTDVGRSLTHITHRLDYATLLEDAQTAFQQLRLVEREVRGTDGQTFVARLLPYRTADDKIDGASMSFVDVSVLRASQHEARAGAEQLRLALESTRDFAVLTTDDAGLVTGWNVGAERLFGYPQREIVGTAFARIFTDEDRAAGVPEMELARAREQGRSEDERWHQRQNGSVFYCSGVTTRLEGGRGFAKIARDLTGSRQSALAREHQLTREQAGRLQAEATMEAKELFLAVMSHELKHPLNLIHLNAELLSRLPEIRNVPAATRAARIIQQTVASQARIIDDLLDLSRARTGKLSLDRVPVDWAATVRRIVEAIRPQAEGVGVRMQFESSLPAPVSLFDPVRAEQVVWNLLNNALKFTPRGGSVRVQLATLGDEVRLTVTDTGRGIDPAFVDRVFEMFTQEPGPRGREDEGMGIGLALVRELVQAQGGRVQVRSEGSGRGAEFTVCMPLHHGAPPASDAAPAPSVLKGMKLLVVDDSADSVDSMVMLLGLSGAEVAGAFGGVQALERLAKEAPDRPFDLMLSDVSMPGMDGHALIAKVREREREQQLPRMLAVACSGYGRAQDEKRAREAGFDALIAKPAALESVEAVVAGLLAGRT